MAITPNMNMDLPVVGSTVGPTWASDLNTALEVVDSHSHTSGDGVRIATAALNINGDLTFNSHNIIDLNSLVLESLNADVATATSVYVKNGELFYIDDSAQVVQITDNGSVAGASGSIGGLASPASATYSAFNKDFTFNYAASSPAKLNIGDVHLFPFDGATVYSNYVSLKSNTALGVQYDWTFPLAHPSKTSPLVWSGAGQVDDIELNDGQFLIGATAGAVAAGSIAGTANQVTVTPGANSITLALPQDIATTSSPTFGTPVVTRLTTGLGTLGAPAVRFSGDTDTGMYQPADGDIAFSNNGTQRLLIDGGGAHQFTGNLTVTGDLTTDEIHPSAASLPISGSINLDGGGAWKATIFTGTLVASDTVTLEAGAAVYGATGFGTFNSSATSWRVMDRTVVTNGIYLGSGGGQDSTSVALVNGDNDSNDYRVIVFHA